MCCCVPTIPKPLVRRRCEVMEQWYEHDPVSAYAKSCTTIISRSALVRPLFFSISAS